MLNCLTVNLNCTNKKPTGEN